MGLPPVDPCCTTWPAFLSLLQKGKDKQNPLKRGTTDTLNHPVPLPLCSCSRSLPQTGKDCPGWHECTPAL